MMMMMTDSDRLALHFCLHFCFVPFTLSCQHQRPSSIGMPSLQFVTHHITPDRSSSSIHTTCFLRTSHQQSGRANPAIIFHAFSLLVVPQHLSGGTLPFLYPFAANSNRKKLAIKITSFPLLILCKPARAHAPSALAYLCIYYPWWYLSRTKKKDFVWEGRRQRPPKKPFVVSKYFIVVPSTRTIITFIKTVFLVLKSRI